jgi:hypothetical protein
MRQKIAIQGVMQISALLVLRQNLVANEPGDLDMSASQRSIIAMFECRSKNIVLANGLSMDYSEREGDSPLPGIAAKAQKVIFF